MWITVWLLLQPHSTPNTLSHGHEQLECMNFSQSVLPAGEGEWAMHADL